MLNLNCQIYLSKILQADCIAFICFAWLSEQTVTFALYAVNSLVFITEVECIYCAARNESLYNTDEFRPQRVKSMFQVFQPSITRKRLLGRKKLSCVSVDSTRKTEASRFPDQCYILKDADLPITTTKIRKLPQTQTNKYHEMHSL
jgi:hypothetical protein